MSNSNRDGLVNSDGTLQIEWVPIARLFGNPANPRINDAAVDPVAASLRRFGWRQPVVARPSGEVIAGNTRLKAALKLGMTEVPVVWFEGPDIEATAYAIADNRTHEFSEWDEPALAKLLEELRAEDSLDGVGYTEADIDELLAELGQGGNAEVDDPGPEEPPEKPTSRPGDLWILGEHRLLCGDSTKPDDIRRLMGEEKPVRLFEIPMEQHTRPGDIILEPFSGSGSQLIAAERLGRVVAHAGCRRGSRAQSPSGGPDVRRPARSGGNALAWGPISPYHRVLVSALVRSHEPRRRECLDYGFP